MKIEKERSELVQPNKKKLTLVERASGPSVYRGVLANSDAQILDVAQPNKLDLHQKLGLNRKKRMICSPKK